MLYLKGARFALTILLIAVLSGCGGGGSPLSATGMVDPVGIDNEAVFAGKQASLKMDVDYGYDYHGFFATGGLALVPVNEASTPDMNKAADYSLTIEGTGRDLKAGLRAAEAGQIIAHLRYDPAKWAVQGVYSHNVWGTEHFTAGCTVPEPGVLVVFSMPVGPAVSIPGEADFATVELVPANSRTASETAPGSTSVDQTIWYFDETTVFESDVRLRRDGVLGDVDSRNGALEDNSGSGGADELTRAVYDHQTHDVDFNYFGESARLGVACRLGATRGVLNAAPQVRGLRGRQCHCGCA